MPFSDFEKSWKVLHPGSEECKTDEKVTICETDNEVKIECNGREPYGKARYCERTNRIESEEYEIRLQIVFRRKVHTPIGGTWTAEDNSTGDQDC
ncbi:MAG TPA: hypothetical protein VIE43_14265 [Thermoanaerobaculia bacterium]|jgi:hypothetical protein|nr:hypothetical protein [Thermoanaerobaculia bacterium]